LENVSWSARGWQTVRFSEPFRDVNMSLYLIIRGRTLGGVKGSPSEPYVYALEAVYWKGFRFPMANISLGGPDGWALPAIHLGPRAQDTSALFAILEYVFGLYSREAVTLSINKFWYAWTRSASGGFVDPLDAERRCRDPDCNEFTADHSSYLVKTYYYPVQDLGQSLGEAAPASDNSRYSFGENNGPNFFELQVGVNGTLTRLCLQEIIMKNYDSIGLVWRVINPATGIFSGSWWFPLNSLALKEIS